MTYKPGGGLRPALKPCPYHRDQQPCEHKGKCPLQPATSGICTTLSPHDIAFVRAAVVGHAVGREEP